MNNQYVPSVEVQSRFDRKLQFFLQCLPLLLQRKFCPGVTNEVVKHIKTWCKKDETRWSLLCTTRDSLNALLPEETET